jgi:hypothetical protein
LESPLPQARFNQQKGKFNALAVHDFGGKCASFATSSASSFTRTFRSASGVRLTEALFIEGNVFAMDEFFHERSPD